MTYLRTSLLAVAIGVAALASTQARANLIISVNGTVESSTDTTNMAAAFTGAVGGFNINNLVVTGIGAFGGNGLLLDVSALDVSTAGTGLLKLIFTETNLTGGSPLIFHTSFNGPPFTNVSVTRSVFVDTTNAGIEGTLVATSTASAGSFSSSPVSLSGPFALVEELDITARGAGAVFSGDDQIAVPEPMSLALFAGGLLGLGLIRRRRQS